MRSQRVMAAMRGAVLLATLGGACIAAAWHERIVAGGGSVVADPTDGDPPPGPAAPGVLLRLFATGDSLGTIEPCGCSRGQFGGVARRAAVLEVARREGDIAVDLGNLAPGTGPQDRLRLRTMLDALGAMGYDAIVPGPAELALMEEFSALARRPSMPTVVCANLVESEGGGTPFPPLARFEGRPGGAVTLVGCTGVASRPASGWRLEDPEATLERVLPPLLDAGDRVIVAGHLDGATCLRIAARWPGLALVLGGDAPRGTRRPVARGGAPVVLVGERAQALAWVDFSAREVDGGRTWLGDDTPSSVVLAPLVERFARQSRALGAVLARDSLEAFRREGRVGSDACGSCHEDASASWRRSPHASAMRTLDTKGEADNAGCIPCHLQDLPPPMAGARARIELGVGCESCHGPGAAHVMHHVLGGPGNPAPLMEEGRRSCARCHDAEHSREFSFEHHWKRIQHGGIPAGGGK